MKMLDLKKLRGRYVARCDLPDGAIRDRWLITHPKLSAGEDVCILREDQIIFCGTISRTLLGVAVLESALSHFLKRKAADDPPDMTRKSAAYRRRSADEIFT